MPLDSLVTGRIATFAGTTGYGWVEALGIKDGRIAFSGSAVDLESRADPHTRRIELEPGEIAMPGLVDAHLHLVDAALDAERLDLRSAATIDDGLAAVARVAAARRPDEWIQGGGWDPTRWGRWPTVDDLERAAPGRHVALWAFDRHALWASRAALAAADPADAVDAGSAAAVDVPDGILLEHVTRRVTRHIPRPAEPEVERAIVALGRSLLGYGVVGVHDPGLLGGASPLWSQDVYVRLAERDELPVRVHAGIREDALAAALERGLRSGARLTPDGASDRVRLGWLKLFADGTLSSGTAALLEPNADGGLGLFTTPPPALRELAGRAADGGIATQVHAIGDAAVRAALDALEPTTARAPAMPRVEHVQLCDPADVARFGGSGIAASVQPVHLREDASLARRSWGGRAESIGYAWRRLLDAGATLALGTDAPVEPIDPWPGITMSVIRRSPSWAVDQPAFGPEQALSLEQALRAATVGPALVARELDRGRLTPGAVADLIVLPASPRATTGEAGAGGFASVRPRLVLVDGETVLER